MELLACGYPDYATTLIQLDGFENLRLLSLRVDREIRRV